MIANRKNPNPRVFQTRNQARYRNPLDFERILASIALSSDALTPPRIGIPAPRREEKRDDGR